MFTFRFLNDKIYSYTKTSKLTLCNLSKLVFWSTLSFKNCLSLLWWQVFLREREKIFYIYSGPNTLNGEHTFSDISQTTEYWISPFQSLVMVIWWKSKRGRLFWWKRAQNRGCWLKWGHRGRSWRLDFGIEIKLTTNCCSGLRSLEQKNFILKFNFFNAVLWRKLIKVDFFSQKSWQYLCSKEQAHF